MSDDAASHALGFAFREAQGTLERCLDTQAELSQATTNAASARSILDRNAKVASAQKNYDDARAALLSHVSTTSPTAFGTLLVSATASTLSTWASTPSILEQVNQFLVGTVQVAMEELSAEGAASADAPAKLSAAGVIFARSLVSRMATLVTQFLCPSSSLAPGANARAGDVPSVFAAAAASTSITLAEALLEVTVAAATPDPSRASSAAADANRQAMTTLIAADARVAAAWAFGAHRAVDLDSGAAAPSISEAEASSSPSRLGAVLADAFRQLVELSWRREAASVAAASASALSGVDAASAGNTGGVGAAVASRAALQSILRLSKLQSEEAAAVTTLTHAVAAIVAETRVLNGPAVFDCIRAATCALDRKQLRRGALPLAASEPTVARQDGTGANVLFALCDAGAGDEKALAAATGGGGDGAMTRKLLTTATHLRGVAYFLRCDEEVVADVVELLTEMTLEYPLLDAVVDVVKKEERQKSHIKNAPAWAGGFGSVNSDSEAPSQDFRQDLHGLAVALLAPLAAAFRLASAASGGAGVLANLRMDRRDLIPSVRDALEELVLLIDTFLAPLAFHVPPPPAPHMTPAEAAQFYTAWACGTDETEEYMGDERESELVQIATSHLLPLSAAAASTASPPKCVIRVRRARAIAMAAIAEAFQRAAADTQVVAAALEVVKDAIGAGASEGGAGAGAAFNASDLGPIALRVTELLCVAATPSPVQQEILAAHLSSSSSSSSSPANAPIADLLNAPAGSNSRPTLSTLLEPLLLHVLGGGGGDDVADGNDDAGQEAPQAGERRGRDDDEPDDGDGLPDATDAELSAWTAAATRDTAALRARLLAASSATPIDQAHHAASVSGATNPFIAGSQDFTATQAAVVASVLQLVAAALGLRASAHGSAAAPSASHALNLRGTVALALHPTIELSDSDRAAGTSTKDEVGGPVSLFQAFVLAAEAAVRLMEKKAAVLNEEEEGDGPDPSLLVSRLQAALSAAAGSL